MALHTGVYSIIHKAEDADFSNFVYLRLYAGTAATPTINGVDVTLAASTVLDIKVNSITPTAGVYLLGNKKDVTFGSPTLSLYPNP